MISHPFRTLPERRKLVGKTVTIVMRTREYRNVKVLAALSKNIEIDDAGSTDWLWAPYIKSITSDEPVQPVAIDLTNDL